MIPNPWLDKYDCIWSRQMDVPRPNEYQMCCGFCGMRIIFPKKIAA